MADRMPDPEVEKLLMRLDSLLEQLEGEQGTVADVALDAVEALTQIYGEALSRMVRTEPELASRMVEDKLLAHLFVLHGLHPDPPEERIEHALQEVRPYLDAHGGDVRLEAISNGVATVSLTGGGCASSAVNTENAVRDAILIAAPELADVEARTPPRKPAQTFIPVEALLHSSEGRR